MPPRIQDSIRLTHFSPSTSTSSRDPKTRTQTKATLIYLISGNPGLIHFYKPFLEYVFSRLTKPTPANNTAQLANVRVAGHSLHGFETSTFPSPSPFSLRYYLLHETPLRELFRAKQPSGYPYSLDEIIRHTEYELQVEADNFRSEILKHRFGIERGETVDGVEVDVDVVLVGHSVGAYILMEILRHAGDKREMGEDLFITSNALGGGQVNTRAGVQLFPTIVDLALSPTGRRLGRLILFPGIWIPLVVFAQVLTLFGYASFVLVWIMRSVLGKAEHEVQSFAALLEHPSAIRQGIYMARHEFIQMTDSSWPESIWNPHSSNSPKLFFYWGADDHWVDNTLTRDRLIREKAQGGKAGCRSEKERNKAYMEIDEKGVPHAFCLGHSDVVGEKVVEWVEDVVGEKGRGKVE